MNAEKRLRTRIRDILSVAGLKPAPTLSVKEVEDGILELFREYGRVPKRQRDEVYAKGRKKVLKALRTSSLTSSKHILE